MKTSGRVRAALAAVALILVAAALLWLLRPRDASLSSAAASGAPASTAAPAAAPVASSIDASATVAPPVADAAVEACERKMQSLSGGKPPEDIDEQVFDRELRSVEDRAVASMLASGDPRTRAAADFWLAGQADIAKLLRAGCEPDDAACSQRADEMRGLGEGAPERLAREAMRSTDAVVYGWAYQVCRDAAAEAPSCQLVSAAQWARISPGNAAAWLAMAADAAKRKDEAALDQAMFQMGNAERLDSAFFVLPGLLTRHAAPDGGDALFARVLAAGALGAGTINDLAFGPAQNYCNAAALADSNRRQTCERVAELFVKRSDTLLMHSIGTGMGSRLGWSGDRIQALRDERMAMAQVSVDAGLVVGRSACRSALSDVRRIEVAARVGELESLRRVIAASGRTTADLAADMKAEARRVSEAFASRAASASTGNAASDVPIAASAAATRP